MTCSSITPRAGSRRAVSVALLSALVAALLTLLPGTSRAALTCPTGTTTLTAGGCEQIFKANGTFTVPAGVTKIDLLVVGGGGGGGAGANSGSFYGGGGGGGGQVMIKRGEFVSPGTTYDVTVGAGGAGATATAGSSGADGGASSFGDLVSAAGGKGRTHITAVVSTADPARGASSGSGQSGGQILFPSSGALGYGPGSGGGGVMAGATIEWSSATTTAGAGGDGVDLSGLFPGLVPSAVGGGGGGGGLYWNPTSTLLTGGTATGGGGRGAWLSASGTAAENAGQNGTANTGGGGGGGGGAQTSSTALLPAGAGGDGLVVVRFTLVDEPTAKAGKTKTSKAGVVTIPVTTTGQGQVEIVGVVAGKTRNRAQTVACRVQATFTKAGRKTLFCTPTAAAQKLRQRGPVRITLTMMFTPKTPGFSKKTTKLGTATLPRSGTPTPVTG